MMFPIQYPLNNRAEVSCFLVVPATLEEIMVRDMLKPRPWK